MAILFFIFGVCFGSFCNVLIYRMPRGESVVFPASHCPQCNKELKFYHNIPLFSWIFLGGKCAFCKGKISPIYPIVELVCGILAVLAYFLGQNFHFSIYESAFFGLCLITLFALSVIDFKINAVPEILLIAAYIFALLAVADERIFTDFYGSNFAVSLIFVGAIVMIKSVVSAWINRHNNGEILEAMGDADTIIIAIIGLFLGAKLGVVAIFLAVILQLIFHLILRAKSKEAPFIPALSFAMLVVMIFADEFGAIFDEYLRIIGVV